VANQVIAPPNSTTEDPLCEIAKCLGGHSRVVVIETDPHVLRRTQSIETRGLAHFGGQIRRFCDAEKDVSPLFCDSPEPLRPITRREAGGDLIGDSLEWRSVKDIKEKGLPQPIAVLAI
jgi:hypothetical protein